MRLKTSSKEYIELAAGAGFELIDCRIGRHVRAMFRAPSGGTILMFFPRTPSDWRGRRNFIATLRRAANHPVGSPRPLIY